MLEDKAVLEHYSDIKFLGKGIQGEVYLVKDKNKKKYALKVYNSSVTKKEIRREIKLLTAIKHPHVIDIKKYGVLENGSVYTLTQYIRDGALDDPVKVAQIPMREKIRIFTQVAHGLMYLHENNIIHRDIKPANIYVKKKRKDIRGI